jgi:excisionase family DNA binding protein
LAEIMTTKEVATYLKLHAITICKLSKEGKSLVFKLVGSGDLIRRSLMSGSPEAKRNNTTIRISKRIKEDKESKKKIDRVERTEPVKP